MKYLIISTTSDTVINFRKNLINFLIKCGNEVTVIAHDDKRKDEIESLGVTFYCVKQDNRSIDPFAIIRYERQLKKIISDEAPDAVLTFQLKPNTFGIRAAHKAGVKRIFATIEGAGDVFINNSLKWKAIRVAVCILYKNALKRAEKVFFLNKDDKCEFVERRLVKEAQSEIIHGIGVDLCHFEQKPLKNFSNFIMIARMLKTKGIIEYCKCARIVKKKYPNAQFNYLGGEGTVTLEDIREYINDGSVNYLGTTSDVRPYIEDSTFMLLPSFYREGLPMSIMEAEAIGRGIITANTVGCRDTVVDGYNGFIVEQHDYEALAEKCIYVIENPDAANQMCLNARKFAEKNFDEKVINEKLYAIIYKEKQISPAFQGDNL